MTIQSVWEQAAVILNDHELALLMNEVTAAKVAFAETYAEIQTAKEWLAEAVENSRERDGPLRHRGLKAQLADLEQRREAVQAVQAVLRKCSPWRSSCMMPARQAPQPERSTTARKDPSKGYDLAAAAEAEVD